MSYIQADSVSQTESGAIWSPEEHLEYANDNNPYTVISAVLSDQATATMFVNYAFAAPKTLQGIKISVGTCEHIDHWVVQFYTTEWQDMIVDSVGGSNLIYQFELVSGVTAARFRMFRQSGEYDNEEVSLAELSFDVMPFALNPRVGGALVR